jgi:hypothetical protein
MVNVKMSGYDKKEMFKRVSTDSLVAARQPYDKGENLRAGYFLGQLIPSSAIHPDGYLVKLYAVTDSCIMDVKNPRSTWATGDDLIWEIIRWVDLSIEVIGESKPSDTGHSV